MLKSSISVPLTLLLAVSLAGCKSDYFPLEPQGANPLIKEESFQEIDLALLLDPKSTDRKSESDDDSDDDLAVSQKRLQRAFDAFYDDPNDQILRRNRVQERIIAASNQRCAGYKQYLKIFHIGGNLNFNTITTVAGGLGSIFTNAAVARALSGTAGIASGLRAGFNEIYFNQQTIQLLARGIEGSRKEIYEEIVEKRDHDMKKYNVENAVGDAIRYHDACSLITGLERVVLNQERAENPSINQFYRILKHLNETKLEIGPLTDADDARSSLRLLTVFLKAKNAKSELERKRGKLKTMVVPPEEPNNPFTSKCGEDKNTFERLKRSYEQLIKDAKFIKRSLAGEGNDRILIKEIDTLISEAGKEISPEGKNAVESLQNSLWQFLWEMTAAEAGHMKEIAVAEFRFKRAEIRLKEKKQSALLSKLNEKVAEADKVLEVTDGLGDRIKKFNNDLENCNKST